MKSIFICVLLFSILLGSCNQSKKKENNSIKNPIEISDVWMRAGNMNRNTAAFFKVTNNTKVEDTLYSVTSDLAKQIQIHETYTKGEDMKGMRHVDFIVVKPHSTFEFQPGSYHVMFIGLNKNLPIGETGNMTLHFRNNGVINIKAEVK